MIPESNPVEPFPEEMGIFEQKHIDPDHESSHITSSIVFYQLYEKHQLIIKLAENVTDLNQTFYSCYFIGNGLGSIELEGLCERGRGMDSTGCDSGIKYNASLEKRQQKGYHVGD